MLVENGGGSSGGTCRQRSLLTWGELDPWVAVEGVVGVFVLLSWGVVWVRDIPRRSPAVVGGLGVERVKRVWMSIIVNGWRSRRRPRAYKNPPWFAGVMFDVEA